MAKKDLKNGIEQRYAKTFVTITSTVPVVGLVIDMSGFESLVFILMTISHAQGNVTLLIEDADNFDFDVNVAEVSDDFLIGTEAETTLDTLSATSSIGYAGKKRFIRASLVAANTPILEAGAIAILSNALSQPVQSQT